MRSVSLGQAVFAAAMIAIGILGLTGGDFAPIWQGAPKSLPMLERDLLRYLTADVCLLSGAGLLWRFLDGISAAQSM